VDLDQIPYKIVFESFRETDGKENWEICLIDADGSGFVNLTQTPEIQEMYPKASPDGTLICFVADEGEDRKSMRRNIYYMNIDGTGRVKVAENAYQPCWSANSKHIAYLPGEYPRYNPRFKANKGIEIYDLETTEVKRHPNDEISHIFNLCWSPDGKWFAAASRGPLMAFKADDNTTMPLQAFGCRPDISPDGRKLAWHGTNWNINIGTLDFNSPQKSVTNHTIVAACEYEYWIYHVDWSPDMNYLTFSYAPVKGSEAVSRPAPGSNICICDLKTGKWTQITTDGKHNKEPDWIPVQEEKP
jgi:Tol biopolymer transport system component